MTIIIIMVIIIIHIIKEEILIMIVIIIIHIIKEEIFIIIIIMVTINMDIHIIQMHIKMLKKMNIISVLF